MEPVDRIGFVAGQNLAFLCPLKVKKKYRRHNLEEIERWLEFSAGL